MPSEHRLAAHRKVKTENLSSTACPVPGAQTLTQEKSTITEMEETNELNIDQQTARGEESKE